MNRFEREDSVCSDRDRSSTTFRLYGNKDNDYKKVSWSLPTGVQS